MTFFDMLTLVGGLSLFLFGMNLMGDALEKRAGQGLKNLLGKLTGSKTAGFLTGVGVTAVIQSSSATTVMVVGFVNSGLMSLRQAIYVIMGANVGTTVTAWILSLTGIQSDTFFIQLLKPSSFTPILALIGVVLYMMGKSGKKKDTGLILLGFATLMFGMETMSGAVSGLKDMPGFRDLLLVFTNPILGVLAGAVLTAIIQSSSASVGILQAVSSTGQITFGAAIPIIMGQNIGTCVTALLSSIGTNRNARRAAVVHLSFNIIGTAVWLTVFEVVRSLIDIPMLSGSIDQVGIAVVHSVFNILCTALLLPMTGLLEKLACHIITDRSGSNNIPELDERLMATPSVAMERCHEVTMNMGLTAVRATRNAMHELKKHEEKRAESIREDEETADRYEDELGTYLVKLSGCQLNDQDRVEAAELLHMIGDFERISDHAVNILESTEELREKGISFTPVAMDEMGKLFGAVDEILDLALTAFIHSDLSTAKEVEPLEQVVDTLKEQLRSRHILRLQEGKCGMEAGFVWADLLTDLERIADHCSNIAGCVVQMQKSRLDIHGYLDAVRTGSDEYRQRYDYYARKYALV